MSTGRMLGAHTKKAVVTLLRILHSNGKELASRSGASASSISNLIGPYPNPVLESTAKNIAEGFKRLLQERGSGIAPADLVIAQAAIYSFEVEFGLVEARLIAPPGGPISSECANYVPMIPSPLDRPDTLWPGTLILEGPARSGVSTSLLAMVREAGKRGINASYYDLDLLERGLSHRPGLSVRDQVGYVLGRLAEQLWFDWDLKERAWNSSNQEEATGNALFNSWRRAVEMPSKDSRLDANRMIVWDHADHLPKEVAEIVMDGASMMQNSRETRPLLPRVYLGISLGRQSPFLASTLGIRVRIGPFDEAQVLRLLTTTVPDLKDPEPVAGRLWELHGGKPYPTHVAAWELRSRGVERG